MKTEPTENKTSNSLKYTRRRKLELRFKRIVVPCVASIIVCCLFYFGVTSEVGKRFLKSLDSNVNGLNREVIVYDNKGDILKTYTGQIDIQENNYGNKVLFDINGKRMTIYNAIVIVEEK